MTLTHWPHYIIDTNIQSGKTTEYFDVTPEEWVEKLIVADEYVYVSAKPCCECHFLPESAIITASMQREMKQDMPLYYQFPVCVCAQVAAWQGKWEVPKDAICYSYFYMHWHDNPFFLAAKEAGRVKYFDMSEYGGMKGSGLLLNTGEWVYGEAVF